MSTVENIPYAGGETEFSFQYSQQAVSTQLPSIPVPRDLTLLTEPSVLPSPTVVQSQKNIQKSTLIIN